MSTYEQAANVQMSAYSTFASVISLLSVNDHVVKRGGFWFRE